MDYLWHLQLILASVCVRVCVSMHMSHYHAVARLKHFEYRAHFAPGVVHLMGTVSATVPASRYAARVHLLLIISYHISVRPWLYRKHVQSV